MNENYEATIANLTNYFERDGSPYSYVAELKGGYYGYTCRILTVQRSYHLTCYADQATRAVIFEISPDIVAEEKYRAETARLLCEIAATNLLTNFRLEKSGNICVHTEQRFVDAPISPMTLSRMEAEIMLTLRREIDTIEKTAHGRNKTQTIDFTRDEPDFELKLDKKGTISPELALKLASDRIDNLLRAEGIDPDNIIDDFDIPMDETENKEEVSPADDDDDIGLTDEEYNEIREMVSSIFGTGNCENE